MLVEPKLSKGESGDTTFEEQVHNYYSNWVWRAIHAIMDHKDFDSTVSWISKKLDIELEEVVEAIEGLEKLGMVAKTEKGFKAKQIQFLLPESAQNFATRLDYHKITTEQILNRMEPEGKNGFYQNFIAANHEEVIELYYKLRGVITEFEEKTQGNSENDGVFGISFSTVDLLKSTRKEEV